MRFRSRSKIDERERKENQQEKGNWERERGSQRLEGGKWEENLIKSTRKRKRRKEERVGALEEGRESWSLGGKDSGGCYLFIYKY